MVLTRDEQVAEKGPSAAFPSSFVVAAYKQVRLTPQDFGAFPDNGKGERFLTRLAAPIHSSLLGRVDPLGFDLNLSLKLALWQLNPFLFPLSVGYPELPHAVAERTRIYAQQLCGPGRSMDFPSGHL